MELLLQHGDHSRNGQGFLQEVDRRCGSLQPGAGKAHRRMSCWCSLSWNVPLRTVSWSGRSWSGG